MLQRTTPAFVVALVALLLSASGCGPSRITCGMVGGCFNGQDGGTNPGNDGPINMGGTVTVSPASMTVRVDGPGVMQQYNAVDMNGTDVTTSCIWRVSDPTFGGFDTNGVFTAAWPLTQGATLTVTASCSGAIGTATLSLQFVPPPVIDPSAPANAPVSFKGPASMDPNERPLILYPLDGAMLARNINQVNLQWKANAKDRLFQIEVQGPAVDALFYVGNTTTVCGGGTDCQYTFADKDWQVIAQSSSGAQAQITVSGTVAAASPVAASKPVTLNYSPEDVKGGLYYFSTSQRGLMRVPFGASKAMPFGQNNTFFCFGCHAVSHDGKKVSAVFGAADQYAGILDGATGNFILQPDMTMNSYVWNFETFSPDGTKMITNWQGILTLRDGNTGVKIKDIPQTYYGAKEAVMPEWSPDGNSIVFIGIPAEGYIGKDMGGLKAGDWILGNAGSVMVMPYNNGSFGPAHTVVPSKPMMEYNFYPSWSPDSQWIVFATGTWPGSSPTAADNGVNTNGKCMSYDQDTARLRLVAAAGGTPIELTAATHVPNRTSSWPKFTPFVQNNGQYVFITYSGKFAYGFVVPDQARPQIWMSAIDLNKAMMGGGDPSYPPFWLPFQDPTQNNHETIWTTDVACQSDSDCPVEFTCTNGACVPKVG